MESINSIPPDAILVSERNTGNAAKVVLVPIPMGQEGPKIPLNDRALIIGANQGCQSNDRLIFLSIICERQRQGIIASVFDRADPSLAGSE